MQTRAREQNLSKYIIWTRGHNVAAGWRLALRWFQRETGGCGRTMAVRIPWSTGRARLTRYHYKQRSVSNTKLAIRFVTTRLIDWFGGAWQVELVFCTAWVEWMMRSTWWCDQAGESENPTLPSITHKQRLNSLFCLGRFLTEWNGPNVLT